MRNVRDTVVRGFAEAPLYEERFKRYRERADPWLPYFMGRVR
jgi:hypothetical protein